MWFQPIPNIEEKEKESKQIDNSKEIIDNNKKEEVSKPPTKREIYTRKNRQKYRQKEMEQALIQENNNDIKNSDKNKDKNKDNDKIIKEIAAELEQSSAKGNILCSNKKEIEKYGMVLYFQEKVYIVMVFSNIKFTFHQIIQMLHLK